MAKINLQGRTFERCCQRFSRELASVFQHPDCPERIRDLIQLFSNEIREEYLPLLSVEEQAKEIRFGTLTGLTRLTKEPPEEIRELIQWTKSLSHDSDNSSEGSNP